jgi:alkaline phosphatase D
MPHFFQAKNLIQSRHFLLLMMVGFSACHSIKKTSSETDASIQVIAFGSCNRQYLPQPLWQPILADRPDLWIWMGDNIYGDTADMDVLQAKYQLQNQVEGYQNLKAEVPIVGVWDDHDYGINDGGKFFAQKKESRDLMFDFLEVPKESPVRKREGGYTSHLLGSEDQLVKVILLDARYFRDTLKRVDRVYQINESGEVLGEEQWKWLEEELTDSPAKIHLIASGIQILPTEHAYEKWANFPQERERLLNLIAKTGAQTPVLLSGDRHIAEIMKMNDSRFPKGIFEITSSGLTHTWSTISPEPNRYRIGALIPKLNYGIAHINWEKEEITFQIKGENGVLLAAQLVPFVK